MNLRVPQDVVFRILDHEAVILNLSSGVYFGLDSVGTRMWQLVSEHSSTEMVVAVLLGEYKVEEVQLRRDLHDLTQKLIDNGLLTTDAPDNSHSK